MTRRQKWVTALGDSNKAWMEANPRQPGEPIQQYRLRRWNEHEMAWRAAHPVPPLTRAEQKQAERLRKLNDAMWNSLMDLTGSRVR